MPRIFSILRARSLAAAWIVMLATTLSAVSAAAATPAETFVQQNVQRGLTILNNHGIPDAQRRSEFRDFLTSLTDIRRIAEFTLGAARRTATTDQVEAFVDAFRDYAVSVYEARLIQYSGQSLKVTGSTERAPGDYVVDTVLVDPNGKTSGQEPIRVDFRVVTSGGKFVVIDASIAGVWLAIEERDQFTAFLQQNNGNVPALTTHLEDLATQLRNGGARPPSH
ncbi:MAG TPA: ABC transporter substrate-binding protein [Rhizomicrobium sp.]|nr:ABC transporter substrate-binding protein [Rhizomicrobium sp.]